MRRTWIMAGLFALATATVVIISRNPFPGQDVLGLIAAALLGVIAAASGLAQILQWIGVTFPAPGKGPPSSIEVSPSTNSATARRPLLTPKPRSRFTSRLKTRGQRGCGSNWRSGVNGWKTDKRMARVPHPLHAKRLPNPIPLPCSCYSPLWVTIFILPPSAFILYAPRPPHLPCLPSA